jgi:hypothetical protein
MAYLLGFAGDAKLGRRGVSIVILLVLVAVLWVVVLAPSAWRRMAERGGVGSVDHFHHQLQLLEHAGPKLVTPAYRLRSSRSSMVSSSDIASSRPKLVLLRPVDEGQTSDIDGVDGARYERVGVIESPEPPVSPAQTEGELAAYRRQQARQRCTFMLRLLAAAAISTGILGALPALRLAWVFTGLTGIAAFALVGLIAYAREVEGQRQQRQPRRHAQMVARDDRYGPSTPSISAAQSGFPGAWDEESGPEERQVATGG